VPAERRGVIRVAVRILPAVWQEEVERFDDRSSARAAAERERPTLEREGIDLRQLQRCSPEGPDRSRLKALVKSYVPIRGAPASERPFGFVFAPTVTEDGLYLDLLAFGERHPRPGTRSVYERAHKRVHGCYPDQ
jgi:hypothetical protein